MAKKKQPTPDQVAFAKSLYVFGIEDAGGKRVFPTLRRVAKRTGVAFHTLAEFAQREEWLNERAFAHEEFYARMKEEMIQKLVEKSIALRTTLSDGARVGINIVTARLGMIARAMVEAQEKQKTAPKGARGFELRDLGMALETYKRVGFDALGDTMGEEFTWRDLVTQAKGQGQKQDVSHEQKRKYAEEVGDGEASGAQATPRVARAHRERSVVHSAAVARRS